jgi:hypothetical protein
VVTNAGAGEFETTTGGGGAAWAVTPDCWGPTAAIMLRRNADFVTPRIVVRAS